MLTREQYIQAIKSQIYKPKFRIELLNPDPIKTDNATTLSPFYCYSTKKVITDDLQQKQGTLTINHQNGVRREVSLNLINYDKKYDIDPEKDLWAGSKFKLWLGVETNNDEYWCQNGVFVIKNPVTNAKNNTIALSGIDKYALLDNQLSGVLQDTYQINTYSDLDKDTPMTIGEALPKILKAAGDPITPYIAPRYLLKIIPFILSVDAGDTWDKMVSQISSVVSGNYFYDIDGRFCLTDSLYDLDDSQKGEFWHYTIDSPEYLGTNDSIMTNEFQDMYNVVKIIGTNVYDSTSTHIPTGLAINDNPNSDYNVNKVPYRRVKYISDQNISNDYLASVRSRVELKRLMIPQKTYNFYSSFMVDLDVDNIVSLTEPKFNANHLRTLINKLSIPLSNDSQIEIESCNCDALGVSVTPNINPITKVDYNTTLLIHFNNDIEKNKDKVKLLLHMDTKNFGDSSPYLSTNKITNTGVSLNQSVYKFSGGSGYFNGKSFLTINNKSILSLNSDFTIDMQVYLNELPDDDIYPYTYTIFCNGNDSTTANNRIVIGKTLLIFYVGDTILISALHNLGNKLKQFSHIGIVRKGNDFWLLEDSIIIAHVNSTMLIPVYNAPTYIGRRGGKGTGYFKGFLDEIRFCSYADYSLTPTSTSYTARKYSYSDSVIDSSNFALPVRNYGVQLKDSPAVFGKSGYFQKSGLEIEVQDTEHSSLFDLNNDFTIDFRINISDWNYASTSDSAKEGYNLFHCGDASQSHTKTHVGKQNVLALKSDCWEFRSGLGYATVMKFKHTMSLNTWYHVAFVRYLNTYSFYIDGKLQGSVIYNKPLFIYNNMQVDIGSFENCNGGWFHGYLDEYRISVGMARWTSEFTPSTKEYGTD